MPLKARGNTGPDKNGGEGDAPAKDSLAKNGSPVKAARKKNVDAASRQRQRTRRKSNHAELPLLVRSIAIVFSVLVVAWLGLSVYLTGFLQDVQVSQERLQQGRHPLLRGLESHVKKRLEAVPHFRGKSLFKDLHIGAAPDVPRAQLPPMAVSDELIDMRDLAYTLPFDNPDGGAWKQGWDVEPRSGPVKVFVIPHSHCDPGWIKTFDEYFQTQTKRILTSVVTALSEDPRRKFVWAEISYFEWWWRDQNQEMRNKARKLLENGQLEFVTGGWVQPDEANTQLYAMEVQLQEGHDWIHDTLGEEYIPKYGWSIDPFGYSPTMAYLLHKYGFKGMLIQRVHYAVKKELAQRKHLEFMWRQTWSDEHDIFCHVMPFYSYDVPHTCGPDPSVCCQFDFARGRMGSYQSCPWGKDPQPITDANVKERAMLLWDQYRKKANLYRSGVVLVPLGDDFRYQTIEEARNQYTNYQKMFDYINANVPDASVQFGTLSEYFEAVMGSFEPPVLKGSFFTYSDRDEDYWSGYFTSRAFDKALDRKLERELFAASSLGATKQQLQEPRRALSLFQHHDGVTGTAKDHVVRDYAERIHSAIRRTQQWIIDNIKRQNPDGGSVPLEACWKSDAARGLSHNLCGEEGKVVLFNPLGTEQKCGDVTVPGQGIVSAKLPCETAKALPNSKAGIVFDPETGMMLQPIREEWKVWKVRRGGAYLFVPGTLVSYNLGSPVIEEGGYVVSTPNWSRKVIEKQVPNEFGTTSTVIDFIFETNLQVANEEWFVRFSGDVKNQGVFHTDLNGFNFDTHRFREDLPTQSQVFPMPTLASIDDERTRLTILSEHAQGTASLQDGSIDVWLDRRLAQDDERGLAQGVMDNVQTRTRLRLVLETAGFTKSGEFEPTALVQRMWDELNHPLEMFGKLKINGDNGDDNLIDFAGEGHGNFEDFAVGRQRSLQVVVDEDVVPFVFLVYKRVDYLKKAIDSLRNSDFDKSKVPLIISHDGHVDEVVSYVNSLKSEFQVIQLFHPYSCSEHPDSFPGDDPSLNEDYKGDSYGNKRSPWATCCKHHFTWMIKTVFSLDLQAENFFFLEEDYVVAPTVYQTIRTGLELMKGRPEVFGLVLDTTDGYSIESATIPDDKWIARSFKTGPMVMSRFMYEELRKHTTAYCTFDEYNWDWSIVHLQGEGKLPGTVLVPGTPQVLHAGAEGGMHGESLTKRRMDLVKHTEVPPPFSGTELVTSLEDVIPNRHARGFGGWGHPADQNHCIEVLRG